jgi:hypothetical protein
LIHLLAGSLILFFFLSSTPISLVLQRPQLQNISAKDEAGAPPPPHRARYEYDSDIQSGLAPKGNNTYAEPAPLLAGEPPAAPATPQPRRGDGNAAVPPVAPTRWSLHEGGQPGAQPPSLDDTGIEEEGDYLAPGVVHAAQASVSKGGGGGGRAVNGSAGHGYHDDDTYEVPTPIGTPAAAARVKQPAFGKDRPMDPAVYDNNPVRPTAPAGGVPPPVSPRVYDNDAPSPPNDDTVSG